MSFVKYVSYWHLESNRNVQSQKRNNEKPYPTKNEPYLVDATVEAPIHLKTDRLVGETNYKESKEIMVEKDNFEEEGMNQYENLVDQEKNEKINGGVVSRGTSSS